MILSIVSLSAPPNAAFEVATETSENPPIDPDAVKEFAPFVSEPSVIKLLSNTIFPVIGFLPKTPSPNSTLNCPSVYSLMKYTFDEELTVVMSVALAYTEVFVSSADSWSVTTNVSISVFAFGSKNLWSVFAVSTEYLNVKGIPCVNSTPDAVYTPSLGTIVCELDVQKV